MQTSSAHSPAIFLRATSYFTWDPSGRDFDSVCAAMHVWCTNTASPPSSGRIKPYPPSPLYQHLMVPVLWSSSKALPFPLGSWCNRSAV
jgi:hypothetical protein